MVLLHRIAGSCRIFMKLYGLTEQNRPDGIALEMFAKARVPSKAAQ